MTTSPEFIYGDSARRAVPLPDGRLQLLGAVDGVTPSMHMLEIGGAKLLIDCGVSGPGDVPPEALAAQALILTHAHNDHLGGLPEMLAIGFNGPILATAPTLEVGKVLLKDSIHLNGGDGYAIRAFKERYKHQIRPKKYGVPFEPVAGKDVKVVFHEAGHIMGSASVEIYSKESRVIISGDLGRPDSPILRDYNTTWSDDRPVDLVLMETTYGKRDHTVTPDDLVDQFEEIIKTALRDGGHILVPSFAIGRTQVLLYLLNELVESGRIENLPVAVDTPMGLKVTNTYKRFERLYDRETLDQIAQGDKPLDFDHLYGVKKGRDSIRLRDVRDPMLIIAGSGMCVGGRIVGHLEELLPVKETCVVFTGYQVPGTDGHAVQQAAANRKPGDDTVTVNLGGIEVPLRAEVRTLYGISAHADRSELATWLRAIPNVKKVLLHHSDQDTMAAFAQWYQR